MTNKEMWTLIILGIVLTIMFLAMAYWDYKRSNDMNDTNDSYGLQMEHIKYVGLYYDLDNPNKTYIRNSSGGFEEVSRG